MRETTPSATAAKKGPDYLPFLLRIHRGKEDREEMSEDVFNKFRAELDKACAAAIFAEPPVFVHSAFTRWTGNHGIIGCLDQPTQAWVRHATDQIIVDGIGFKAWSRGELSASMHKLAFWVPEVTLIRTRMLETIVRQNQIPGKYRLISVRPLKTTDKRTGKTHDGTRITIGADEVFNRFVLDHSKTLSLLLVSVQVQKCGLGLSTAPGGKRKATSPAGGASGPGQPAKKPASGGAPAPTRKIPTLEEWSAKSKTSKSRARKRLKDVGIPWPAYMEPQVSVTTAGADGGAGDGGGAPDQLPQESSDAVPKAGSSAEGGAKDNTEAPHKADGAVEGAVKEVAGAGGTGAVTVTDQAGPDTGKTGKPKTVVEDLNKRLTRSRAASTSKVTGAGVAGSEKNDEKKAATAKNKPKQLSIKNFTAK